MKNILFPIFLIISLHAQQPAAQSHTFTAIDGRELQAVIVAKSDGEVTLRRVADGRVFALELVRFSEADQARVRDWRVPDIEANELGNSVLTFCTAHLGRRVGRGECAHLAVEALKASGAGGRRPDSPNKGDYVWGDLVAHIRAFETGVAGAEALGVVQPGDVVQLRNVRFAGPRPGGGTYTKNAVHHTVIVERADVANGVLHILHQNVNGVRTVRRDEYRIDDLKQGWLRVYRPVAAAR